MRRSSDLAVPGDRHDLAHSLERAHKRELLPRRGPRDDVDAVKGVALAAGRELFHRVAGDHRRRLAAEADLPGDGPRSQGMRSEEHTSELQSLMRISYAVFCLKKKK